MLTIREHHNKLRQKYQAITESLELKFDYLQNNQATTGLLPDGTAVEIFRKAFKKTGYFGVFWGNSYLVIKFNTQSQQIIDTTIWTGDCMKSGSLKVGVRLTHEVTLNFDLMSLLEQVESWSDIDITEASNHDNFVGLITDLY